MYNGDQRSVLYFTLQLHCTCSKCIYEYVGSTRGYSCVCVMVTRGAHMTLFIMFGNEAMCTVKSV